MTTKELIKLISDNFNAEQFRNALYESELIEKKTGLDFEFLDDESERDNESYFFRFRIGDKFYEWCGSYDSENSVDVYFIDFYEVVKVERVVEVWEQVSE